jgi:hypothetical protein
VGVGVGVGGTPADNHVMTVSLTVGCPAIPSTGRPQYSKACLVPLATGTNICLYLSACGVAAVLSVIPTDSNAFMRSVRSNVSR